MKYTKKQIKTATNRIVDSLEWLELSENAKCVQVYGVDYEGDFHEVDNNWREVIADELICFGVENANRKLGPYEDEPKNST
ncbi:MAG: hypothetical protein MJ168_07170 [Clostridia bacterium]|nr:hypothetical protein [Clostridia bacterium]